MNAPDENLLLQTNSDLMARRAAALPRGVGQGHAVFTESAR
jgi:4-aminobutyrate aminotransferase/4-aminobutyrate aminotransferase/(S)-3-amino-2-methylpropionate transaminase